MLHKENSLSYLADEIWQPLTKDKYQSMYEASLNDADNFWQTQAKNFISWFSLFNEVQDCDFKHGKISWFLKGKLNVSYNCLDRHLATKANDRALIWQSDEVDVYQEYTYQELYEWVCQFANGLKAKGIKKGSRVCIYMPMIPQATVAMLACARIGAVHSVVFGGFSPQSLAQRITDAECEMVITADFGVRGGKKIPLKNNVDMALGLGADKCINTVVVVKWTKDDIAFNEKDVWFDELTDNQPKECEPEIMDSEDPLFILYTSGSTGKPKGVLHTTAGYLLYATMTFRYVFDYQPNEVYWCTADVGWVTGHSYIVYGPLSLGGTTMMFEGVPTHPTPARFWETVDKHQVNIFYTAPTAIRALMGKGDKWVKSTSRKSLRILGTVGEPINPEAWRWYHEIVGDKRCPVMDTWWQTETGGIMMAPYKDIALQQPGAAGLPFFGVKPELRKEGKAVSLPGRGELVITQSWPGQMRTVYGDHDRFLKTYFSQYTGCYFAGDGAKMDEQGEWWITGRVDDVINVSGHRIGTAEVESVLVAHPKVAESAVIGIGHDIKGQGLFAYVTLVEDQTPSDELKNELNQAVIQEIGKFAMPEQIMWASDLPKTRSGKIMRRILRKIAEDNFDELGDTSTLADPSVVESLIESKKSMA